MDYSQIAYDALRLAIPVMRNTVCGYLEGVCIRNDPATISRMDWAEIAPDLAAIRAAEACVGPQPDQEGVDTDWLNAAMERAP